MKIRVFAASDHAGAMTALRRSLGEDALILEIREVAREAGGGVEILAAADTSDPLPCNPIAENRVGDSRARDDAAARGRPMRPARRQRPASALRRADLAWHGIGAALSARLLASEIVHGLHTHLRFGALPLAPGGAPLLLSGEPGAGKTTMLIKVATRLVIEGRTPMVVSTDARKAGATEQLAAMTRILGLTLIVAEDAPQLARALARRRDGAPVLIDTPGLVGSDAEDEALLTSLAQVSCAEIVAVLPAGLDVANSVECARHHARLGATRMLATRLDVSRRIGGILEAAWQSGLLLTEAGIGPDLANGLEPVTPSMLASRLVGVAPRSPDPFRPTQEIRA